MAKKTSAANELMKAMKLGPFDAEAQVRAFVASAFWKDGVALRKRYQVCNERDEWHHREFRSKMFVDLVMAIECAMKCLIIALAPSGETPEDAYNAARKCSHNLQKLLAEVEQRAVKRLKLKLSNRERELLGRADKLGVGKRYLLDSLFILRSEGFAERELGLGAISGTLDNEVWLKELAELARKLLKLAGEAETRFLGRHHGVNGVNIKARADRLEAFARACKFI